jgi:hypothetical protein
MVFVRRSTFTGILVSGLLLLAINSPIEADAIAIDTGLANWTVSIPSAGVANVVPFIGVDGRTYLCLDTHCDGPGTWVPGASVDTFDGFWFADLTFSLPAQASDVRLTFSNFLVDDRGVMSLNGTNIAATATAFGGLTNASMVFTDGGPNIPYTFSDPFTSGTVSGGFNIGGLNTLEVIVNNTFNGAIGPVKRLMPAGGDGTDIKLVGAITFTATPEPSNMILVLAGIICLFGFRIAPEFLQKWG